jgi:hypothetical protein
MAEMACRGVLLCNTDRARATLPSLSDHPYIIPHPHIAVHPHAAQMTDDLDVTTSKHQSQSLEMNSAHDELGEGHQVHFSFPGFGFPLLSLAFCTFWCFCLLLCYFLPFFTHLCLSNELLIVRGDVENFQKFTRLTLDSPPKLYTSLTSQLASDHDLSISCLTRLSFTAFIRSTVDRPYPLQVHGKSPLAGKCEARRCRCVCFLSLLHSLTPLESLLLALLPICPLIRWTVSVHDFERPPLAGCMLFSEKTYPLKCVFLFFSFSFSFSADRSHFYRYISPLLLANTRRDAAGVFIFFLLFIR